MIVIGKEPVKMNKTFKVIMIILLIIIVSLIGFCSYNSSVINEPMYILNNLDEKAVHKNDFKIPKSRSVWIKYKDTDFDGDFDSYLQWENSSKEMKQIRIVYGENGQFIFSNLDKEAIRPDDALSKKIQIDYQDIDNDGELESIVRD